MLKSASTWPYQFSLLAQRNFQNIIRLPQTSYVKLIVTILTALFCVVLFAKVDETLAGVQNRNGALFFITMTMSFNAIQNVILSSQMRGQSSSARRTTICTMSALTSGPRSSQNSHQASLPQPSSAQLFTSLLGSVKFPGGNSHCLSSFFS